MPRADIDTAARQSFVARPEPVPAQARYDVTSADDEESIETVESLFRESLMRTAVVVGIATAVPAQPFDSTAARAATDFSHTTEAHAQRPALVQDRRSALASDVKAYRGLEDNWDGEEGISPARSAIDDALAFIELLPLRARLPRPMVSGDGEVGFYWKTDDCYVDVGFFGDGMISYYGRSGRANQEARGPEPFNRRALPKDLLDVINLA